MYPEGVSTQIVPQERKHHRMGTVGSIPLAVDAAGVSGWKDLQFFGAVHLIVGALRMRERDVAVLLAMQDQERALNA